MPWSWFRHGVDSPIAFRYRTIKSDPGGGTGLHAEVRPVRALAVCGCRLLRSPCCQRFEHFVRFASTRARLEI